MVDGVLTNNPVAIGVVASQIVAFEKQYQQASPLNVSAPNPNYIGTLLQQGLSTGATNMLDPNLQTPRSLEMNIGVQRETPPRNGSQRRLLAQRGDALPSRNR